MLLEEIIQKILSSRPGLTRDIVLRKIEVKKRTAKGFLTDESAARTVATELGIELTGTPFKHRVSIKDFILGLGNVTVVGRVIFVFPLQRFTRSDGKEGRVRRLLLGDETGVTKIILWDDKADQVDIENLIGRIMKFSHGYIRQGLGGKLELNIGSKGGLEIDPPEISDNELPALNSYIKGVNQITGNEGTVNILGVVGQTYPVSAFKREDGSEGKVRQLELEDHDSKIKVVLWNEKVDELKNIETGIFLEIFNAKVKKLNGLFELQVDNSSGAKILVKAPQSFKDSTVRFMPSNK